MKWTHLCTICCSPIVCLAIVGCNQQQPLTINVDPTLAPVTTAVSGQTLKWVSDSPDETFKVIFDPGLCTVSGPITASYGHPAVCTVAPQTFAPGTKINVYTYVLDGTVNGKPTRSPKFKMAIGPGSCKHC